VIVGETRGAYVLTPADVAHTVLVFVTASNSVGSLTANAHPTDIVLDH
jgi:hypothetical protein